MALINRLHKPVYTLFLALCCLSIVGCASKKNRLIKPDTPTLKTVYEEKFKPDMAEVQPQNLRTLNQAPVNDVLRNELESLAFQAPRLPNPTMIMYIYPHVTDGGTPVPAYATYFTFYKREHFAIDGEPTQ